jgi:D-alanyl-D-alanine carboxypeptidase
MLRSQTLQLARLCAALAVLTLTACGGSSEPKTAAAIDARSTLAFGPCAVPIADPSAICGTLTVAEDRADKNSRLIGLPFLILPARAATRANDPVVIFTGGPGPSSIRVFGNIAAQDLQNFTLRQKRDVMVMTQRGTDLTSPQSLDCSELVLDFAAGERFATEDAVLNATRACRDRLIAAGAKLSTYTTKIIARDMEDLRVLLGAKRGFDKWNLVGSSYGSRLAQAYVRDMPQGVRSVVYDGPSPLPDRDLYYAGQLDALSNVINACNAQADCAAAYPNLRSRFATAIERLETTPEVIQGVRVRGHEVLNAIRAALAVPNAPYENLPLFMDRIAKGDLAGAQALLPFVDNLILAINPEGMFYTVTCTDDAGLTTASSNDLPPGGVGWPDAVRRLIAKNGLGLQARSCPLWTQRQTLSTDGLRALRSDIPSLITVGQFDGSTPTTSGDALLAGLSRARKVVFTGRGHGLLESDLCMQQVAAAFLDDPTKAPDTSCVEAPVSLRFTTAASVNAQKLTLQSGIEEYLRVQQPLSPSVIAQVESPGGALSWSGASGLVDRSTGTKVTPQTAFRIASTTKTFTSAAIHRLAEQGLLRLDDSISRYLEPATTQLLSERGYATDKMTVTQLLAHTSGLPDHDSPQYQQAVLANPTKRWTRREQLLFGLDRFPKVGAPGEKFQYSDTGYILLGEIIERKTGVHLGAAYRRLLSFDALGMTSTWMEAFEPAPPGLANFAHAYGDNGLDLRVADATVDTYGGGGLVSTVGDLTKFMRALLEGRVVSPASLVSMQTASSLAPSVGRGIYLLTLGTQDCWAHEGFWGVGMYYCPASRASVALTINLAALGDLGENYDPTLFNPATLAAALLERVSR